MRRLLRFSAHHPRIVVGVVVTLTLLLSLLIPRVRLRLDARSLIPAHHPDLAASDAASSAFGLRDVVMVGVTHPNSDIYNVKTLARIARLTEAIAHTEGVVASSVRSIANTPRLFIRDNTLDVRPLLSNSSEEDAGAAVRVRSDVEALGLNDGVLVARDSEAALIVGDIQPDADRYLLLRRVKELTTRESQDGDSIYLSGTAPAQAVLGESSARDLMHLIPLVIVVLGAALAIAFRHPAPALISLAEIGASLIWTVGLMGLTGQSVFVTTLVLPVILIAVGVSDDVYVLKHYFAESGQSADQPATERVIKVFGSMIWPVALTTISTVVGLLSMVATSLQPLQIFGVFGAVAILFSTLFTFSFVPALLILMNPSAPQKIRPSGNRSEEILASIFRGLVRVGPRRVLACILLVTICALLLTTRLRVDDSWIKNLPPHSEVVQSDSALNGILAGTTTLDLMLDSGQPEGFLQPQFIRFLLRLEDSLSALPFVGVTYGIHTDVLRLNASLHGMSYRAYRAALLHGRVQLNQGEIEQALMLLTVARRAPLGNWIDNGYRRVRVTVFIRSANYQRIAGVLQTISATASKADGQITPFGDGWISYTTVRLLVEGQIYSIALALCTDLLLLTLLLRSFQSSLMAIIPVAFSVLVVFAVLALTDVPLGIANSMFAGIAIGIGLDFAIHLTAGYRRNRRQEVSPQEAMRRTFVGTGPAIVTSALSIALGFSVLALSEIMPNVQLGLMICLSLTVCALATLVIIPCLVLARKEATRS